MKPVQQTIRWGLNVDTGFTGVISRRKDFISAGIDWFERYDRLPGDPPCSHAFIITGQDQTIEAFADGVKYGTLTAYLNDPNVALFAKRAAGWTPDIGSSLVGAAARHLGERYNYGLIAALAISNSLAGHGLDLLTGGWFGHTVTAVADRKRADICSQLVAQAMRTRYGSLGMLTLLDREVKPQRVYEDQVIYEGAPVELVAPGWTEPTPTLRVR